MAALALTLVVFGSALAAATPAHADDGAVFDGSTALGQGVDGADQPDHPRRPIRPAPRPAPCARLGHMVAKACPCNGPDGAGWGSHDEFVDCVAAALEAALADNDKPRLEECATRILERAEASQVGEEGFECPTRPVPKHPGRPTKPTTP
jgi:hypothetical protein